MVWVKIYLILRLLVPSTMEFASTGSFEYDLDAIAVQEQSKEVVIELENLTLENAIQKAHQYRGVAEELVLKNGELFVQIRSDGFLIKNGTEIIEYGPYEEGNR